MTRGTVRRVTDVIAHRGVSRLTQENTIEAFELAVGVGADAVELDVRRAADGVLVVHHDARVNDGRVRSSRPCGGTSRRTFRRSARPSTCAPACG